MAVTFRRIGLGSVAVACMVMVTACGEKSSYGAVEDALGDWLTAGAEGNESACDLETNGYHKELVAESTDFDGPEITCEERVAQMAAMDGDDSPPAADSEMDVPVWDPSGEALVEVTDARSGDVKQYWMVFEDGGWLVAGDEP